MVSPKIFLFLLALLIIGCSCSAQYDTLPGITIPLSEMNQEIQLIPNPGGDEILKNDTGYDIQIKNLSDHRIIFPGDYGLKLFTEKNKKWSEVDNTLTSSDSEIILPLTKEFPPGRVVSFIPHIINLKEKITLRIVVVGHDENASSRTISAYIDLPLSP